MNTIKNVNLVYKIKKRKSCEKRCGGSSVNGISFNKKFLKLIPSCKSVHPLQRSYLNCKCHCPCRRLNNTHVF